MTAQTPPAVPRPLAERFAKSFAAFVDALRADVSAAAMNPALSSSRELLTWQTKALPLLEQQNAVIQNAWARFLIGEERTIIGLAADKRGLGKDLEGFSLAFAGPDRAKALDQLLTAVVIAAYQLCAAAGIP